MILALHIIRWESDDSSQTNSFLKCGIINLMSGLGVLGFWAWDDFWGRIITDSFKATWIF